MVGDPIVGFADGEVIFTLKLDWDVDVGLLSASRLIESELWDKSALVGKALVSFGIVLETPSPTSLELGRTGDLASTVESTLDEMTFEAFSSAVVGSFASGIGKE